MAQEESFSLTRLAALAQSPHKGSHDRISRRKLAAALHLYALSNGCDTRLQAHIYQSALREKQQKVAKSIGARDVQRLALRGLPMMSLPVEYREIMDDFQKAYHAPEIATEQKLALQQESRILQLTAGISPTQVAEAVGIAPSNASSFLVSAALEKVTVDTALEIRDYLAAQQDPFPETPS